MIVLAGADLVLPDRVLERGTLVIDVVSPGTETANDPTAAQLADDSVRHRGTGRQNGMGLCGKGNDVALRFAVFIDDLSTHVGEDATHHVAGGMNFGIDIGYKIFHEVVA